MNAAAAPMHTLDWLVVLAIVTAPFLYALALIHTAQWRAARRDRIDDRTRRPIGGAYDVRTRRPW
jgi:hypothetical protein